MKNAEGERMYYAHTKESNGAVAEKQLLKDHLINTAELAENNALEKYGRLAYLCGLMHDIGKYQIDFQKRLDGKNIGIEHSGCGAKEANGLFINDAIGKMFAYIIAGHHGGLPDYGKFQDDSDKATLCARLKRKFEDYSAYKSEVGEKIKETLPGIKNEFGAFGKELMQEFEKIRRSDNSKNANDFYATFRDRYEFLTRYIFSCLVDADFLDTETFCDGKREGLSKADWDLCLERINAKFASFKQTTPLQKARSVIQSQAYNNANADGRIFLLDMPTGSGKTLCGVKIALERALSGGKKRIIYVIPYTSIIEQTADELQKLFPEVNILQHHSNFDFEESELRGKTVDSSSENGTGAETLKKAAENWDASIIITTNVQFFESIYSNKVSRLRKMHNMANSVLVFDEIHTLPIKYLSYCMKAIDELTKNYNSEAVFMTATMPDFNDVCEKYFSRHIAPVDLVPDKSAYSAFKKCGYEYLGHKENVLECFDGNKSALFIFNRKRRTEYFYNLYNGGKKYCLTTYMTPEHRSDVIKHIREDLAHGEKIAVFSTSLIEAGVDLDFETVFRELAGIDNILQAGGRCNREGKRAKEESIVHIFEDEPIAEGLKAKANTARNIINVFGADNIDSAKAMNAYYEETYKECNEIPNDKEKKSNDLSKDNYYHLNFAETAESFKFIDSTTVPVVIPCEEIAAELQKLDECGFANRRKLQKYCAAVSVYELKELLSQGVVSEHSGIYVLDIPDYYSNETGIRIQKELEMIC